MITSQSESLLNLLQRHPALAPLDAECLQRWVPHFTELRIPLGTTLFEAGEPGECAYLILSGKVRALRETSSGRGISVGTFTSGDFFGGHVDPEHWRRPLTCRTAEDSVLYRIARADLEQFLREQPELQPFFDRSLAQTALLRSLQVWHLLAGVPEPLLPPVLATLEELAFPAGATIVREGETADCLYSLRTGRVQVSKQFQAQTVPLTELGPGDYFGERALLLGEPRHATVIAAVPSSCYRLRAEEFVRLTQAAPLFKWQLARRLHCYLLREEQAQQRTNLVLCALPRSRWQELVRAQPDAVQTTEGLEWQHLLDLLQLEDLLGHLPVQQALWLLGQLQHKTFRRGEILWAPGQSGMGLLAVHRGLVRATRAQAGRQVPVGSACAGAFWGPADCAEHERNGITLVAQEHCECYVLDNVHLQEAITQAPAVLDLLHQKRNYLTEPAPPVGYGGAPPSSLVRLPEEPFPAGRQPPSGKRARYPWVPQRSATDCAVAALLMLSRFHGLGWSWAQVRERVPVGQEGANLLSVALGASALGLDWQAVLTDFAHLCDFPLPAIAHWQGRHYIVLYRVGSRSVLVGDPQQGLIKMSPRLFQKGWMRRLLALTPRRMREPFLGDNASS